MILVLHSWYSVAAIPRGWQIDCQPNTKGDMSCDLLHFFPPHPSALSRPHPSWPIWTNLSLFDLLLHRCIKAFIPFLSTFFKSAPFTMNEFGHFDDLGAIWMLTQMHQIRFLKSGNYVFLLQATCQSVVCFASNLSRQLRLFIVCERVEIVKPTDRKCILYVRIWRRKT